MNNRQNSGTNRRSDASLAATEVTVRKLSYPPQPHDKPIGDSRGSALWRYLAGWLAASAVAVALLAIVLPGDSDRPEELTQAARRASCRFERGSVPAPRDGRVVLVYRSTLSGREIDRVRAVAHRVSGDAMPVTDAASTQDAVAAVDGDERLGCPRIDARTEEALTLFVLSSGLER
jgi:hypothetical protein